MSYRKGDPVIHAHGQHGTVTRDATDHAIVYVRWDGAQGERQEFPECVHAPEQAQRERVVASKTLWDEYRAERTRR